jgi:hypothetical protein
MISNMRSIFLPIKMLLKYPLIIKKPVFQAQSNKIRYIIIKIMNFPY